MADDKKSPGEEPAKDEKKEAPVEGQTGKEQEDQAPLKDLPEKFEGKTAEEIAKSYVELEKKLGSQSKELEESRELKKQFDVLNQVVTRNPELYKSLESEVNKMYGREPMKTQGGDGEAQKTDPQIADLRRAEETRAIADFQHKFGINKMPPDERKDLMKKVSNQLADLRDPGGTKPISQILSETRLDQLPKLLENSYWIVNKDSLVDRGKFSGQDMASIGSIAASSGKSGKDKGLTDRERNIAQSLGVDPDKYYKQKQSMLKS